MSIHLKLLPSITTIRYIISSSLKDEVTYRAMQTTWLTPGMLKFTGTPGL